MILWMILLPKRNVYKVPDIIGTSSPLLFQFSSPPPALPTKLSTPWVLGKVSSQASRGPLPAPLSPCSFVPAQLEQNAVTTSAVKRFVSLKGSKDIASTANEEMSFSFSASGDVRSSAMSPSNIFGVSSFWAGLYPSVIIFSLPQHHSLKLLTPDSALTCPKHSRYIFRSIFCPRRAWKQCEQRQVGHNTLKDDLRISGSAQGVMCPASQVLPLPGAQTLQLLASTQKEDREIASALTQGAGLISLSPGVAASNHLTCVLTSSAFTLQKYWSFQLCFTGLPPWLFLIIRTCWTSHPCWTLQISHCLHALTISFNPIKHHSDTLIIADIVITDDVP